MSGIRDLSIIATPPEDRRAIRTFVIKFEPQVIREAIAREIQRGGQVFFVHNRVQSSQPWRSSCTSSCPEARLAVAHGQMDEDELDRGDERLRRAQVRRAALHVDHRERGSTSPPPTR